MELIRLRQEDLQLPLPQFDLRGCWLAGGIVRDSVLGAKASDADVFGKNSEAWQSFLDANQRGKVSRAPKMWSFKAELPVQIILREYASIEACLDSFDYTICQFAFDGEFAWATEAALVDTFRRRLVVHKITKEFALDSLRRAQKYIKKGYTACAGTLADIGRSFRDVSEEELQKQMEYYPSGLVRIVRFD